MKGQVEIMGMAVIVILVTLGIFFILAFQGEEEPREYRSSYEKDQFSSTFILSLLKTNPCGDGSTTDVSDLISYCALGRYYRCGGYSQCEAINKTVEAVLSSTLEAWNEPYLLRIKAQDLEYVYSMDCGYEDEGVGGRFSFSLYPNPGSAEVSLKLCN